MLSLLGDWAGDGGELWAAAAAEGGAGAGGPRHLTQLHTQPQGQCSDHDLRPCSRSLTEH
jgi:hypothetical protein